MSLSSGQKASWEDIKAIYNDLNTQRTRFGFSTTTVPNEVGTNIEVNDVSSLKSLITAMRSNSYIAGAGLDFNSIHDVTRDTPIRVTPFTESNELISRISNVCPHDAAFFAGNNGYNSSYFSSLVSFNSSYNSSNNAYNSSFNTSNNGYNSSFNSSNNTYNSSNYSFGRSGRTSGNVSYNTSKNSGINVSV